VKLTNPSDTCFDAYALDYDAALNEGLSVSGEDKTFFARERIAWLARCLASLNFKPENAFDFGCGTGSATPFLFDLLQVRSVAGVDVSPRSIAVAARQYASRPARFCLRGDYEPDASHDIAFCNGVFHHIPPNERPDAVRYVRDALQSGGLFAFWENNPWNLGTRYVMSKIPFDRDAITLTAGEARSLLTENGFEIVRTDYLFIFPKLLKMFRGLEPSVSRLPLGAQYQVLARKN
jgi:SAM-dependent methyltransferase